MSDAVNCQEPFCSIFSDVWLNHDVINPTNYNVFFLYAGTTLINNAISEIQNSRDQEYVTMNNPSKLGSTYILVFFPSSLQSHSIYYKHKI